MRSNKTRSLSLAAALLATPSLADSAPLPPGVGITDEMAATITAAVNDAMGGPERAGCSHVLAQNPIANDSDVVDDSLVMNFPDTKIGKESWSLAITFPNPTDPAAETTYTCDLLETGGEPKE